MDYKEVYHELGKGHSNDFQLLSEEKWILKALAKIKNQRNCLQIERLHLESIKSKIKKSTKQSIPSLPNQVVVVELEDETSTVNLMQNTTAMQNTAAMQNTIAMQNTTEQNKAVDIALDDVTVNDEELNLVVNNVAFNTNLNQDLDMEEDEVESDDDMLIDMNLLMNGTPSSACLKDLPEIRRQLSDPNAPLHVTVAQPSLDFRQEYIYTALL